MSISNFCAFEQSRDEAHLKSNFMSELGLSSLPIIILSAEYIVLINFTKVKGCLKLHFLSY